MPHGSISESEGKFSKRGHTFPRSFFGLGIVTALVCAICVHVQGAPANKQSCSFSWVCLERMLDLPITSDHLRNAQHEEVGKLDGSGPRSRMILVGGTALISFALVKRSRAVKRAMRVARHKVAHYTPRCIGRILGSTPSFLNWRPPRQPAFGVHLGASPSESGLTPNHTPSSSPSSRRVPFVRTVSMPSARVSTALVLPVENRRAKTCTASALSRVAAKLRDAELEASPPDEGDNSPAAEPNNSTQHAASQSPGTELLLELEEVFDACAPPKGCLCEGSFQRVVALLNERFGVGIQCHDAERLRIQCENGRGEVDREAFLREVGTLLKALRSSQGLSLTQLRIIMATAFERFDTDADGNISETEFAAALSSCDIHLSGREIAVLLKLLSPGSTDTVSVMREDLTSAKSPSSLEEQVQAAFEGARENLAEATGWNSALKMAERFLDVFNEPGTPKSQLYRAIAAFVGKDVTSEMLADTSELLITLASVVLVLHAHSPEGQIPAECVGQFGVLADDMTGAFNDLFDSGPMGPVLLSGLLGAFKSLRTHEQVSLSEREALLFARGFHDRGCSTTLFQKLLACGHCQWTSAAAGDMLQGSTTGQVQVLVRGEVEMQSSEKCLTIQPGEVMKRCGDGEKLTASTSALYVTLDVEQLVQCIQNSSDSLLVALATELLDDAGIEEGEVESRFEVAQDTGARSQSPESPESPQGWLSPLKAALQVQAKRKGFSVCTEITDGLQHIISQTDISLPEKLERCRTLFLDNADVFVESFEALVDITGACSALLALWNQSSTPTPENILQLAPIIILLSLVLVHAARRGASTVFSSLGVASP
ncbi:unnamed protein product [Symbiodinium sp. CCMP2456]|nr:unnamed protein product [Symbiodinium sp. CCMP2456]